MFMPLFWGSIFSLVGVILYQGIWLHAWDVLKFLGALSIVILTVILIVFICIWIKEMTEETQSVFIQGVKAVKSKFCPIIEIK